MTKSNPPIRQFKFGSVELRLYEESAGTMRFELNPSQSPVSELSNLIYIAEQARDFANGELNKGRNEAAAAEAGFGN